MANRRRLYLAHLHGDAPVTLTIAAKIEGSAILTVARMRCLLLHQHAGHGTMADQQIDGGIVHSLLGRVLDSDDQRYLTATGGSGFVCNSIAKPLVSAGAGVDAAP